MRNVLSQITTLALVTGLALATTPLFAGGGGSKPLDGSHPIVLSHGLFGWGNDTSGAINIANYWGGMDEYLRSQGAAVYVPAKSALGSNEVRAQQLKDKLNYWMAANGHGKVHIIGHSQGGLDSRYMTANLGMRSKVSTLTSLNTPHRGSPISDLVSGTPSWFQGGLSAILEVLATLIYGDGNQNGLDALASLSIANSSAFNQYTPNASGVKYYSYGSKITIPDAIQHPTMFLLHPFCGAGGLFYGQGFSNDGLVNLSSMKWGTWKGGPSYGILITGIDHLQASNTFGLGELWYDVEGYFLKMAKNAKDNQ